MLEIYLVVLLYLIYRVGWKIKQLKLKRKTGINPHILNSSKSGPQLIMRIFSILISLLTILIIIAHILKFELGMLFMHSAKLSYIHYDIIGFITGLLGLTICFYSQYKLGESWRIGIDSNIKTELITSGLFGVIRNPTYLGIFVLNIGVYMLWPTVSILALNLLVLIFFELQVRFEEKYLLTVHREKYLNYKNKTKRYIPYIY